MKNNQSLNFPISYLDHKLQFAPFFRPSKNVNAEDEVVAKHDYSNGDSIEIFMKEQLSTKDQDIFLAILSIAYAEDRGSILSQQDNLRNKLHCNYAQMNPIAMQTTKYELLKELHLNPNSTSAIRSLEKSLNRLKETRFILTTSEFAQGYCSNLISVSEVKNGSKPQLKIAINSYLSRFYMEKSITKNGIIFHNRNERMSLNKDVARFLHFYLSGLVNIASSRNFHINTLIEKIYQVKMKDIDASNKSKKRKTIQEALLELNMLKYWKVEFLNKNLINIKRGKNENNN